MVSPSCHYTHFGALGGDETKFVARHLGRTPSPDSCMCKAHNAEAKRYWSQEGYTPKWKESATATGDNILSCIHPQCPVKLVSPAFEEIDNLEAALCTNSDVPWVISGGGGDSLPVTDMKYLSNAEEADMRIWRRASQTSAQCVPVYSP